MILSPPLGGLGGGTSMEDMPYPVGYESFRLEGWGVERKMKIK